MEHQENDQPLQSSLWHSLDVSADRAFPNFRQIRPSIIRMVPVKRKLEELELGADTSSGRLRRDSREDFFNDAESLSSVLAELDNEESNLYMEETTATSEAKCEEEVSWTSPPWSYDNRISDDSQYSYMERTGSPEFSEGDVNTPPPSVPTECNGFKSFFSSFSASLAYHTDTLAGPPIEDCRGPHSGDSISSEPGKMKVESASLDPCNVEAAVRTQPEEILCDDGFQETGSNSADHHMSFMGELNSKGGRHAHTLLQFFVKTFMDGRTIVLHANVSDTIESVHRQIFHKTGIPLSEQRLIYFGRQLQQEQTLSDCQVTNDATLHLVARMRSTALPHSWQLVNDLVATIRGICCIDADEEPAKHNLIQSQLGIRAGVKDFLKMAMKSAPFSEHMQIFQHAGATAALVMLLLSPLESNCECAEEAIKLFFYSNEEFLPAHMHSYCAPVLLEFCQLLAKSAPFHTLYPACRNALACLLDIVGPANGCSFFQDVKADTIVQDFAPFVNELSVSLCSNLRWTAVEYASKGRSVHLSSYAAEYASKGRSFHLSSYVKDGQDFTAFTTLLCKALEACRDLGPSCSTNEYKTFFRSPRNGRVIDTPKTAQVGSMFREREDEAFRDVAGSVIGSPAWIKQLFYELLQAIDDCLAAIKSTRSMEEQSEDKNFWWAPFLIILKGLHSIAQLFEAASRDLLRMVQTHQSIINKLIMLSRWQDDHSWLLDYKDLLSFESKRRLAMMMLPEPQDDHDERHEVAVTRANLLSESFEMLAYADPDALQGGISVEFISEEATGPGVLREWFFLICREIFNPQNALFKSCSEDGRRVFPNAASAVNAGHLTYFRFCGRVIALALIHRVQINVAFALAFFKQLARRPISWQDMEDADPFFYKSCLKVLEMDAEEVDADVLGLTFVCEEEQLGTLKTMELCPGGKDVPVNSQNRLEYLQCLVKQRFVNCISEQVKSFSQGFSELLVSGNLEQFLRGLEVDDFNLLLHGKEDSICLNDWKLHTEYHDYSPSDDQIVWFWQVLDSMTSEQCRKLLFFSTSLRYLPVEGFAGLHSKFHIHRSHMDTTCLPTAHTCFFQLMLPLYPSLEVMHEKLSILTGEGVTEGFGFA